jgi:hypothetical protein
MNIADTDTLESFVPLQFKRHGRQLLADTEAPAHDVPIIETVGRAIYWQHLLDTGKFKSGAAIARAEGLMPTSVNRFLRLAQLAPNIVEQILGGHQPRRLTLRWLMRHDIPVLWDDQRQIIDVFD